MTTMKTLLLNLTCLLAFCFPIKLFSATLSIVGSPVQTIYACSSSTLTDTVKITGGVAPFSYSWTNNSMATFKNDSVFSYAPSVAGVDTMICTVTDKNGISVVKKIRLYSGIESSAMVNNFPTNIELPSALDPTYKKYYSFSVSPKGAKVVGIDEFKAIQQDSLYYVVSKPLYTPDTLLKAGTYHYVIVLPDSLCPVKGKANVLTVNVFQKLKITIPVSFYQLCFFDAPIGFPYTVTGGVKPYTVTIDKGGYNANTPGFYVVNYSVVDSIGNKSNVIETVRIQPMEYTDITTTKQYFNIQEKGMTLKYVSSMSISNTFKLFNSSNNLINTFVPTLSTEITIPINNLISGNYLIVAKSMSSCLSKQASFNFSLYNSPSVSIAKTEICLNDTTKVYISASGYGTPGSYTDFQTDVTFDASKLTFVGATMNNTILPNAKLLTINKASGNISVAYNQNNDQFNTYGNLVCLKFVGIATGKSPITLVNPRIDGHSFLDSTNGEVTVHALPSIAIKDTSIQGGSVTFIPVSSEIGPYTWITPTQTNISSTTMLTTGFGWYYVTATNSYGCTSKDSANLTLNTKPTFSVVTNNVCYGDTIEVSFNTTMLKYESGFESYVIEFNTDGLIPIVGSGTVKGSIHEGQDAVDAVYNNDYIIYGDLFGSFFDGEGKLYSMKMLAPKAGTYSITIVDAFINAQIYPQKENATITIFPSPTVQIKDTSFCKNAIGNLKPKDLATGIYHWEKPGNVTEIANMVFADKQGTYTIKYTDSNGCLAYDTAIVTINEIPTITINNASICSGNSHTFIPVSSENGTYSWTLPDASKTVIKNLSTNLSGLYSVTATNSAGCSNFDTALLTINQSKIQSLFDISEIDTIQKTYTFTSKVNPSTLNWVLPDGTISTDNTFEHIFTNTIMGDVCLTVSDDNGCINKKCTTMTATKPGILISIKGTVSSKSKEYIEGVVVAYYKRVNSYIALDSATIQPDGTYSIEPLPVGVYLVKGIANDENKYQPTYYYNAQYENKAVILNLTGNATSVDIMMNQAITGVQINEKYSMIVVSNNSKGYAEIKINSAAIDKLMIVSMLGQIIYTTENPELTTYISKQNVAVGTYVVLGLKSGNIVQTKYMIIK